MGKKILILKEDNKNEKRTPLTPNSCRELLSLGNFEIFVMKSQERIFKDLEYLEAGCKLITSPKSKKYNFDVILGIEKGMTVINKRFDYENIKDENKKPVVGFEKTIGVCGMGVGIIRYCALQLKKNSNELNGSRTLRKVEFIKILKRQLEELKKINSLPSILVFGEKNPRIFKGIMHLLQKLELTEHIQYTKNLQNIETSREYDIYVNFKETNFSILSTISKTKKIILVDFRKEIKFENREDEEPQKKKGKEFQILKSIGKNLEIVEMNNKRIPSLLAYDSSSIFSKNLVKFYLSKLDKQ